MKNTIFALLICIGVQAQEVTTTTSYIFVDTDIWNIPNGADTANNKEVAHYFDINDTIVANYYANNPEAYNLIIELNASQTSYLDKRYHGGIKGTEASLGVVS